ncbi:MAG: CHASE2 domain-containing protein [Deltaproteobacteria bacterium]|nr:CHASE2 domain-containing protein [Deltaproteobacteria bacterium]
MKNNGHFLTKNRSQSCRILGWGLAFTLVSGALFLFHPTLTQPLDAIIQDRHLRSFPDNHPGDRPVIIDLDEKSLQCYGQWPWPRYRVARLLDKIAALHPAAVGLDMIFPEPDGSSAGRVLNDLEQTFQIQLRADRLPAALSDNDTILAASLAKGPFVLGNKFHFQRQEKSSERCSLHPVKVSLLRDGKTAEDGSGLPESAGVLCNLPLLSERVTASGFFNYSPDRDGMLRRLPLLVQYKGRVYANLALATVLKSKGIDHLLLKKGRNGLEAILFQGTSIPVDPHGQLLIKFRGPRRSFEYISAADILAGAVPRERLQGRIAFIGTSATGLMELRSTPFDPILPGVEVHATVADNLLSGDFISAPGWSHGAVLFLMLALGTALSLLVAFRGAAFGVLVLAVLLAGLWLGTQQLFFQTGYFIATAFPMAALIGNYLLLTLLKYRLEETKTLAGLRELLITQDAAIESMASLAEYRSQETGSHIKRTRRYVRLLAEQLRSHPKYKPFLNDATIDLLYKSAPLHDIGKVGIPGSILLKPGPLTAEEFQVMKAHTVIGRNVLEASIRKLGRDSFLSIAAEIALSHQEKWDGSGYPQGLRGEAIPLSGRLMALADVYDALISKRSYKEPSPHNVAVEYIREGRGTHFDPEVVAAFLEIHERFREIACQFADVQEERDVLAARHAPRETGTNR